ncbi:MAG: hypothetical protein QXT89_01660 [Candidatus Micrarchaeaceae archaeon]
MIKTFVAVLAVLFVFGTTNASSTVVLSGTCGKYPIGGAINFSLSNSGNTSAYSVVLSPRIVGISMPSGTYNISLLNPGESNTIEIPINNLHLIGSYVMYLIASYQQGASTFTAVFPCLITVNKSANSQIYATVTTSTSKGISTINASIFSAVQQGIVANVSLILPPGFDYLTNSSYAVTLLPYARKNVTFTVKAPQTFASYSGGVALNYKLNGINYAALATIIIAQKSGNPLFNTASLVYYAAIIIIVIIAFLIVRSAVSARRHASKNAKNEEGAGKH